MQKLEYCYHTHTSRCGHAVGEDEEYVKSAIEAGVKRLGFSDHVFFPAGFEQEGIRGAITELNDYLSSIHLLKEKYKDQIDIKVGFEAEFCRDFVDYYEFLLKEKVDYLIMGQHCYEADGEIYWYLYQDCPIKNIKKYVDDVIEGLKTGMFKYLAHPDHFMMSQRDWNEGLEKESRRLLKACEELNIPIEINMCGMRRKNYNEVNYSYPNINFFNLVKDYNLKVVLGYDAHSPSSFFDGTYEHAVDFAKRTGLKIDWDYFI